LASIGQPGYKEKVIIDNTEGQEKNPSGCPKLETRLYQLTQSEKLSIFAKVNGLYFSDGKVRLVIELRDPSGTISDRFHIAVKGQTRNPFFKH